MEAKMAKEIKKKPQFQSHTSSDEKKKALENAIAQIEKTYGAGAVMKLGQTKNWILELFLLVL